MRGNKFDFSGWATKNDLRCSDGRTIRKDAFIENDGKTVPLVWQHQHNNPENVLGHALLENREEGVYAYCKFNDTSAATHAKELVKHGDITALSIYANQLKQNGGNVYHGLIREVSLVLAGANPQALIDFPVLEHSDGGATTYETLEDEATIYTGLEFDAIAIEHEDKKENEEPMNGGSEKTVNDVFNTFTEEQKNLLYLLIANATGKMEHADEYSEELFHADEEENEEAPKGKTAKEVFDSLNEEQKKVLYFLVGKAVEEAEGKEQPEEDDEVEHGDYEGGEDFMKYNVFDQTNTQELTISHADMEDVFANAKRCGSLKAAFEAYADVIQHSVSEIDSLFPDPKAIADRPDFLKREDEWVAEVWNGTHKTPFSRIKTVVADITADEARAKGYIKGNQKVEEVFGLLKRTTTPQTVYKLQKLNRDDVLDITDFDVVSWIKAEMRVMLNEELSRAILVGDGRLASSNDKIDETHIRPIYSDADFYTIKKSLGLKATVDAMSNEAFTDAVIEAALRARKNYKGSGTPKAFATPDALTTMLLAKDGMGHRLYKSVAELAAALRVSKIVEVPVMETASRTADGKTFAPVMVIVNLNDYNVGADKGGAVNMFDDFDINYNKYEYLIETRCSGALVKPYAAISIEVQTAGSAD